jgi:hypothetical protein
MATDLPGEGDEIIPLEMGRASSRLLQRGTSRVHGKPLKPSALIAGFPILSR